MPRPSPLPDAKILAKLCAVDPGAGEWVMVRAERIAQERRRLEGMISRPAFKKGLLAAFRLFTAPHRFGESFAIPQRDAWETVGNDLRRGISDYCAAYPAQASRAGLSEADVAALAVTRDREIYARVPVPAAP